MKKIAFTLDEQDYKSLQSIGDYSSMSKHMRDIVQKYLSKVDFEKELKEKKLELRLYHLLFEKIIDSFHPLSQCIDAFKNKPLIESHTLVKDMEHFGRNLDENISVLQEKLLEFNGEKSEQDK